MPLLPVIVKGAEEYEVEVALPDSKITRGKLMYYVDWKGYSAEERTWEPAENLSNAGDEIATYHAHHPQWLLATDIPAQSHRTSAHRGGVLS